MSHDCLGCGKPGIPNEQLACKPCWFRLPKPIRDEVWRTWRRDRDAHPAAIAAADRWWAAHPSRSAERDIGRAAVPERDGGS